MNLGKLQRWWGTERPGMLKSMGLQTVRYDWATEQQQQHDDNRASPVVQRVKNPPIMQETQVLSLIRENPLEKEMATHYSILAWKKIPFHGRRSLTGYSPQGHKESEPTECLSRNTWWQWYKKKSKSQFKKGTFERTKWKLLSWNYNNWYESLLYLLKDHI